MRILHKQYFDSGVISKRILMQSKGLKRPTYGTVAILCMRTAMMNDNDHHPARQPVAH